MWELTYRIMCAETVACARKQGWYCDFNPAVTAATYLPQRYAYGQRKNYNGEQNAKDGEPEKHLLDHIRFCRKD